MKGYIALSRVQRADDVFLAQVFSPCLFTQGKQQWPSLLLDVQTGSVSVGDGFPDLCAATQRTSSKTKKLVDAVFRCDTCQADKPLSHFLCKAHDNPEWYDDVQRLVLEPGSGGRVCGVALTAVAATHMCAQCSKIFQQCKPRGHLRGRSRCALAKIFQTNHY